MTSTEAVEVVHQMMAARERELAAAVQRVRQTKSERRKFWKEVLHGFAVYGTATLGTIAFTLLMAVLQ